MPPPNIGIPRPSGATMTAPDNSPLPPPFEVSDSGVLAVADSVVDTTEDSVVDDDVCVEVVELCIDVVSAELV